MVNQVLAGFFGDRWCGVRLSGERQPVVGDEPLGDRLGVCVMLRLRMVVRSVKAMYGGVR